METNLSTLKRSQPYFIILLVRLYYYIITKKLNKKLGE